MRTFLRAALLLFWLMPTVGRAAPIMAIPTPDAPGLVYAHHYNDFNAAINEGCGSSPRTLVIAKDMDVTASITVPSTCELQFIARGMLVCDVFTVTVQSSTANWPSRQIFAADCKGRISFSGAGSVTSSAEWWGAAGGGTTDDTTTVQAAINAACTATKGVVELPKTYLVNTVSSVPGIGGIVLYVGCDNLTIDGQGTGTVRTTNASSGRLLTLWGIFKPGGISGAENYQYDDATVYTMTNADRGDQCLTLATVGQAANFAAGDYAFIRTGQTVDGPRTSEPDAELKKIVSANAGTGQLCFDTPLGKNYRQECFVSGTQGITTTTCGGLNPAAFGVSNVTDRTLKNLTLRDVTLESTTTDASANSGGQIDGIFVQGVKVTSAGPAFSYGQSRNGVFGRNIAHLNRSDDTYWYCFSTATGTSDFLISDNVCTGHGFMHSHEGGTRIKYVGNIVNQDVNAVSADNAFSIRARGYDVSIIGNTIFHDMPSAAIRIESDVTDGVVIGNTIAGGNTTTGIGLLSTSGKWAMSGNVCQAGLTGCGVVLPSGTLGSDLALSFALALNTGLDRFASGRVAFNIGGVTSVGFAGNSLIMPEAGVLRWVSGTSVDGATYLSIIDIGAGTPEGIVTANKSSIYLRTDGGAGTTFYVKESGTGNTGWAAK